MRMRMKKLFRTKVENQNQARQTLEEKQIKKKYGPNEQSETKTKAKEKNESTEDRQDSRNLSKIAKSMKYEM